MRSVIAGTLALVCGCASVPGLYTHHPGSPIGREVPVYLDDSLSPTYRQAAIKAVEEWDRALNGNLRLKLQEGTFQASSIADLTEASRQEAIVILEVPNDNGMIQGAHVWGAGAITYPWNHIRPSALIYLTNSLNPHIIRPVVLHELGHAFGLGHEDGTLMQGRYAGATCLDKETMKKVGLVFGWELSTLNYCE